MAEPPIFDAIASVYDETRTLPPDIMEKAIDILATTAGEKSTLLDVGVGTGRFAVPLSMMGLGVTGIDISCGMMSKCRQKGFSQMFQASAYSMPFKNACFDNALMVHVLHLMGDWKTALRETCRVTRCNLISVISHWPETDWPGIYYAARVDELGYGPAQAGKFERELGEIITPTKKYHVGAFLRYRDNDQYIRQLEKRQFSSATKLPDDLHAMVIKEARERFGGGHQDVPCRVEVYLWDIGALSNALASSIF